MYIHGSTVEIQIAAHWNLIGNSKTALPPVLSPSSTLLTPLSRAFIPTTNNLDVFHTHVVEFFGQTFKV
jgi:hypothetical protein